MFLSAQVEAGRLVFWLELTPLAAPQPPGTVSSGGRALQEARCALEAGGSPLPSTCLARQPPLPSPFSGAPVADCKVTGSFKMASVQPWAYRKAELGWCFPTVSPWIGTKGDSPKGRGESAKNEEIVWILQKGFTSFGNVLSASP